jgi:outer membrane protein
MEEMTGAHSSISPSDPDSDRFIHSHMKKPIRSLTLMVAALVLAVSATAQPALKVVTIDLAKAYDSYWETKANEAKLREAFQRADEQAKVLRNDGTTMVDQYRALEEKSNNSMLTQEARDEASSQLQELAGKIQAKQQELQQFVANTQRSLEMSRNNHQTLMMDKIKEVALDMGHARGATMMIDTSGPTGLGFSNILFSDPSYDITEEVIAELAKTKPADEEIEATEEGATEEGATEEGAGETSEASETPATE